MGTVIFRLLAGGLAGLIGWILMEPTAPATVGPEWSLFELRLSLMAGALIGATLGAAIGWQRGSRSHIGRGCLIGFFGGAVGCLVGKGIGGAMAHMFFGLGVFDDGTALPIKMMGRAFVGVGVGSILGLAVGVAGGGGRRVLLGFIGGAIGGFASGFLFDPLSSMLAPLMQAFRQVPTGEYESGQPGRMVLFVTIGALVGAFTGLVELVAKTAWVRQNLGRNEGREWAIYNTPFTIGRNERSDVPIYGDPHLQPQHAYITKEGSAYWLNATGQAPVYLNGQPISRAPLDNGSQIQVGGSVLEFMLKAGSAPARAAEALRGKAMPTPVAIQQPYMPPAPTPAPVAPIPVATSSALVILSGPLVGQRYTVNGALEIGREGSGVALPHDQRASRRHVMVTVGPNGLTATDLQSTNGTAVNGNKITEQILKPGDILQLGETSFRVE